VEEAAAAAGEDEDDDDGTKRLSREVARADIFVDVVSFSAEVAIVVIGVLALLAVAATVVSA
jgi:hypothetical protein